MIMSIVSLTHMRDLLLPGLMDVTSNYKTLPVAWSQAFERAAAAPHVWIPKLSVPQAFVIGAAAAIIKNPDVTRRFWQGWVE